jgi:hypothetical protein
MLKVAGFRSVRAQHSVFFTPALARSPRGLQIGMWVDALLNAVPLIRNLGGIYTLVATK